MTKSNPSQKLSIKYIFRDNNNWETFKKDILSLKMPSNMVGDVIEQVEKALGCGDPRNGYSMYKCPDCHEEHVVAFTCKSRFCSSCGKKYVDNWVEKQVENILDVSHRHIVFTVPQELRRYIYWNREILKDLSDGLAEVIQRYYRKRAKKKKYEVGIITVVHTFGRDSGFNPHIHALITEGALDKYKQWKSNTYISYEYMRKSWQKVLLDIFKEKFAGNQKVQNLINMFYRKYKDGFYINAESRMKNARGAARYIGRYLARPALAEYRIISYDGKTVRFWYDDHETKQRKELTLPIMQFIGRLIMHIAPKHFRMVRRYGLYRRDFNKRAQQIIALWQYMKKRQLKLIFERKQIRKKRWRERIIESFKKDPLKCKKCGGEMILWEIWSPKHDFIYHAEHTDDKGKYIRKKVWEEDPRNERRRLARLSGNPIPVPR